MKITINSDSFNDSAMPIIGQVEEQGFEFKGFATTRNLSNESKEYHVFQKSGTNNTYYIKKHDRENNVVEMAPKDFSKIDRIFWQSI